MDVVEFDYETVPQSGLNGCRGYQPRGKTLGLRTLGGPLDVTYPRNPLNTTTRGDTP